MRLFNSFDFSATDSSLIKEIESAFKFRPLEEVFEYQGTVVTDTIENFISGWILKLGYNNKKLYVLLSAGKVDKTTGEVKRAARKYCYYNVDPLDWENLKIIKRLADDDSDNLYGDKLISILHPTPFVQDLNIYEPKAPTKIRKITPGIYFSQYIHSLPEYNSVDVLLPDDSDEQKRIGTVTRSKEISDLDLVPEIENDSVTRVSSSINSTELPDD